jgi:branched-chain amino acid transport system permease protein
MKEKKKKVIIALFVVFSFVVPLLIRNEYHVEIFIQMCIFIIVALGLNLLTGYAGQLSLGHAAFCAIGGYVSGWLAIHLHFPFLLAFVIAAVATGLLGSLIGFAVLTTRGPYLAMITIGLGEIIRLIIVNIPSITGGPMGMTRIPRPLILAFEFSTTRQKAYLALATIYLCILFIRRLMSSKVGRAFLAIRENEDAAAAMGINTHLYKTLSFGISALIAGMAGSLYAHIYTVLSPEVFNIDLSVQFLTMVVIGGMGTLVGPILGAVFLVLLPEVLRVLAMYQMLIYGVLLMLCMSFLPYGIMSFVEKSLARLQRKGRANGSAGS